MSRDLLGNYEICLSLTIKSHRDVSCVNEKNFIAGLFLVGYILWRKTRIYYLLESVAPSTMINGLGHPELFKSVASLVYDSPLIII